MYMSQINSYFTDWFCKNKLDLKLFININNKLIYKTFQLVLSSKLPTKFHLF